MKCRKQCDPHTRATLPGATCHNGEARFLVTVENRPGLQWLTTIRLATVSHFSLQLRSELHRLGRRAASQRGNRLSVRRFPGYSSPS